MKFEWRKHEKALYGAKVIPALVDIPTQNYIMIKGSGNPNDTDFSDKVGALFSLAYAIKMGYKSTATKNILSTQKRKFGIYHYDTSAGLYHSGNGTCCIGKGKN